MIRNYLTVALRNLEKYRFYSLINVAGLAIGIASCLVSVLFVTRELSYDRFHEKADRIYRLNCEIKFGGNHYQLAVNPAPVAAAILNDFPEVESAVRFRNRGSYLVKKSENGDNFKETAVIWTDSTFFRIFSIPVIAGNPGNALKEPNSIAISKKMADKYFPKGDALGSILILDNTLTTNVTAVFEDMPDNSHFHFDILISMPGLDEAKSVNFLSHNFNTYVLLKQGADAKQFEVKLQGFVKKYVGPQAASLIGADFQGDALEKSENRVTYTIIPLTDIHLHSHLTGEFEANTDITYIYLFVAVALFILILACINFMNLSTARSANRAKEVGVRKVVGSLRSHLIRQFLLESVLLSVFSFLIAIGLVVMFLPILNELSQKSLSLPFDSPLFYILLTGAAVVVGALAGVYPAFFLSSFQPAHVLKGHVTLGMKSGAIRSVLVVFQFVITIFLIIATITIYRQLDYIQNKKIGFNKDQVLVVNDAYALRNNLAAFKEAVLKNNFIQSATVTDYLPVDGKSRNDNTFWPYGSEPDRNNMVGLQNWFVDHDYVKTLDMKIIEGRDFSADFPSDSSAVILNEAAAYQFSLGDNPIGKRISTFGGNNADGTPDRKKIDSWTVIGIVENFNFQSLKQNIAPVGFFIIKSEGSISFRFKSENTQDVIQAVEKSWKALAPGQPFQYSFLDEDFGNMYESEQRLGGFFGIFACLAIVIACLGLLALTAFTAQQRTKEIGIRKSLGASVSSIVLLLSREFGKLIFIACLLTMPLAWYAVNWWLKNYTYKVEVGIGVYVLAAAFAFVIAGITMGYQSIAAASSSPIDSLKSE